jgi:hypothetical protein
MTVPGEQVQDLTTMKTAFVFPGRVRSTRGWVERFLENFPLRVVF